MTHPAGSGRADRARSAELAAGPLLRRCPAADPVGTGKTYVALAVAAAVNRRSQTACVVPLHWWTSGASRAAGRRAGAVCPRSE